MSKKLFYLVSFVLVFSVALTNVVNAADPDLVAYINTGLPPIDQPASMPPPSIHQLLRRWLHEVFWQEYDLCRDLCQGNH